MIGPYGFGGGVCTSSGAGGAGACWPVGCTGAVAGGHGFLLSTVLRRHKTMRGVLFDLPHVVAGATATFTRAGVGNRVRIESGGFFKELPSGADAIIMKHILHDWDLPTKKMLIAKAYDALPSGGSFIVFEALIDDERRKNAFGLLMSLNMLIETSGGFDYTGVDGAGWMKEAGFKETRVIPLTGPDSMVIGVK